MIDEGAAGELQPRQLAHLAALVEQVEQNLVGLELRRGRLVDRPPEELFALPARLRSGTWRGGRSGDTDPFKQSGGGLLFPLPWPANLPGSIGSLVEGPIGKAVWKLAWPTVLQNMISGLQGVIDHALVGHLVGYAGNAAIGVAFQIFLVVMVFIVSLFTGMGVLIARYTGANDGAAVNRAAWQAFLTAIALSVGVLAPVGYFLAPHLLGLVNAAPAVQAQALPYLRIMFGFSLGMMLFFMLSGALRSAGDARTPLKWAGIALTILNIAFNIIFIRGLGPIPAFGTAGAAMGMSLAGALLSLFALWKLFSGRWVIDFRGQHWKPDWAIIKALFRFGLPTGLQGIAMNVAGVLLLRFSGRYN